MPYFVDQFCQAVAEWSQATGEPMDEVVYVVLYSLGGVWLYEPIESFDTHSGTVGKLFVRYSVAQMRERIETLVTHGHVNDAFLVVSLIKALETWLEERSENSARENATRRDMAHELLEFIDEPQSLNALLEQVSTTDEDSSTGSQRGLTGEGLRKMLESISEQSGTTIEALRKARLKLDCWRRVTSPLLERELLEAANAEFVRRFTKED